MSICSCSRPPPLLVPKPFINGFILPLKIKINFFKTFPIIASIRASKVDYSYDSSSNFVKRMEQAWLISQQPGPVACSSCDSYGLVECKWCGGTGFFVLGNNLLCQVPSRNTSCVICSGKGSTCCPDCKGTGFRAKWLGEPPPPPGGGTH